MNPNRATIFIQSRVIEHAEQRAGAVFRPMANALRQSELFGASQPLPHGLVYRPEFLSHNEESSLLDSISGLPFREARFQQYFAKRRVVHYHAAGATTHYDASDGESFSSGPLPPFLGALLLKVSTWIDTPASAFVHALVSEYRPVTPIGWHRDKPVYGTVVGISMLGWGRMRFRPIAANPEKKDVVVLDLEPRSAYVMRGAIRWDWQHSMLPTKALRYSITFRTLAFGESAEHASFPQSPTQKSDPR
jgi:alkylated DNA repair dioxygenase AlkB